MRHLLLATDGSYNPASGRGGWAAVFAEQSRVWTISGAERKAVSPHHMELQALAEGLGGLKEPCRVCVFTDDRRVLKHLTEDDKDPDIRALWQLILRRSLPHAVSFEWVKGHDGHPLNEQADRLAALVCTLPLTENGRTSTGKPASKKAAAAERTSPLIVRPALPVTQPSSPQPPVPAEPVKLHLSAGENHTWAVQVSGQNARTQEGVLPEGTFHQRLLTALDAGLFGVLPGSDIQVTPNLNTAWQAIKPAKAHRDLMLSLRQQVKSQRLTLRFGKKT